jgi:hypothetical protein
LAFLLAGGSVACFANKMTEPNANKGLHPSSILLGLTRVFLSSGALITVSLEVRVLPGPPRILARPEIS